jgi:acetyl esterase/lipase
MSVVASIARQVASRVLRHTPTDVDDAVTHFRARTESRMMRSPLPRGVGSRSVLARGAVPAGLWVGVPAPSVSILYLHGGAYVAGVPETYAAMVGTICRELEGEAFLARYRLAPEHRYPAAIDDAVAAYRMMLGRGTDPSRLAVMGDSAGGGLALATVQRLCDEGDPLPAAVVALSPWADLTCTSASASRFDGVDPMLTRRQLELGASAYLDGADPATPGASPVFGDFAGFPPLLLTAADDELLLDDALSVADRAERAGVTVEVIQRPGVLHVWPMLHTVVPEARADLARIVAFLGSHLADGPSTAPH